MAADSRWYDYEQFDMIGDQRNHMTHRTLAYVGTTVALTTLALPALGAPTALQILQSANDSYWYAKTYQATYRCRLAKPGQPEVILDVDLKTVPGKKTRIRIEPVAAGAPQARALAPLRMYVFDDGKTGIIYSPASNVYLKGPHTASYNHAVAGYGVILGELKPRANIKYSLLTPSKVGKRPVYVVQGKGIAPGSPSILLSIDRKTYAVLQVRMTGTTPAGPTIVTSTLTSGKINAPISDSVFKFTPPPGAKEIKMPARQAGQPGTK
jgi:outer membrane lipoprotein-sorting protein